MLYFCACAASAVAPAQLQANITNQAMILQVHMTSIKHDSAHVLQQTMGKVDSCMMQWVQLTARGMSKHPMRKLSSPVNKQLWLVNCLHPLQT